MLPFIMLVVDRRQRHTSHQTSTLHDFIRIIITKLLAAGAQRALFHHVLIITDHSPCNQSGRPLGYVNQYTNKHRLFGWTATAMHGPRPGPGPALS